MGTGSVARQPFCDKGGILSMFSKFSTVLEKKCILTIFMRIHTHATRLSLKPLTSGRGCYLKSNPQKKFFEAQIHIESSRGDFDLSPPNS